MFTLLPHNIFDQEPLPIPDHSVFSTDLRDFITMACNKNPFERASAVTLLKHKFITRHWLEEDGTPRSNVISESSHHSSDGENVNHHHQLCHNNTGAQDAMRSSREWIQTSLGSLTRRPGAQPGRLVGKRATTKSSSNNSRRHVGVVRPSKSASDKPSREPLKLVTGTSGLHVGQLESDSVMLTKAGRLIAPGDSDLTLARSSDDSELKVYFFPHLHI